MTQKIDGLLAGKLVCFFDLANSSELAMVNEMRHQTNEDTFLIQNTDKEDIIARARNIFDYIDEYGLDGQDALIYEMTCKKLVIQGHLMQMGTYKQGITNVGTYLSTDYNQPLAEYGAYDMDIKGFPEVRLRTMGSIFQAEVTSGNGSKSTGTAFLIENNYLVTARHVIEKNEGVTFIDSQGRKLASPESIMFHSHSDVDVAVIKYGNNTFAGFRAIKMGRGEILDEILSLGYPRIIGDIKNMLICTTGQIAATTKTFTDGSDFDIHVITAKVKGGNSGGPIVNRLGMAVGIVTSLEYNDETTPEGKEFGFCTHIDRVNEIIKNGISRKFDYEGNNIILYN